MQAEPAANALAPTTAASAGPTATAATTTAASTHVAPVLTQVSRAAGSHAQTLPAAVDAAVHSPPAVVDSRRELVYAFPAGNPPPPPPGGGGGAKHS